MLFQADTPQLNDTDMAIYRYVSANAERVAALSVRELAAATSTSTASVLRFCKKFGASGYAEFKVRLTALVANRDGLSTRAVSSGLEEELLTFFSRITSDFYQARINEAAQLLSEKEIVLLVGVGSSNIMARYGALYFSSIFGMAVRVEDPNNTPIEYLSPAIAEHMCVVALSVSGETQEVIAYLDHFNLASCSSISITNTAGSTIARMTDVNIPYYVSTEKNNEADITTQVPALYMLEKLAREVRTIKQAVETNARSGLPQPSTRD